ncbi:MAG: response regulator [Acidobacteriota bacterium]|nr:response regulator [Acidobacteriota bacterium]
MIVDDYVDALDIWAIYLRSIGYGVSTAADGLSAVAKAEELLPDLIVLDLELPGLTGFEVATRLRANKATAAIPLIAATGYSHARQLDLARASGFDAVVVKPCDPDVLVQEVERLLAVAVRDAQVEPAGVESTHENG